jgi:hypothetical protein
MITPRFAHAKIFFAAAGILSAEKVTPGAMAGSNRKEE